MIEKLLESLQGSLDSVVAATPMVLSGIALIVVALIAAKIVEKVLRAILVRIRFDDLAARAGIDKTLQKAGLRHELNHFLPRLAYFLLLFLLAKTVADTLELTAVSEGLASFFAYLPNLLAAIMLVVLGSAAASFAGDAVTQSARDSGLDFAPALGRAVSGLILFIVAIMALGQLRIDTEIIRLVTAFGLAGLAIAFGLSFGLGTREITRNILAGFYARKILKMGAPLELKGQSGVLQAVTPTHTLIESEGKTISIANGTFLDEISRQ